MRIVVWSDFYKRKNSSRIPIMERGQVIDGVKIYGDCSVVTPQIILTDGYQDINYVFISDFHSRFYFVRNSTFSNGHIILDLEVDVLASWSNDIGDCYAFVMRSGTLKNENIVDSMVTTQAGGHFIESRTKNPYAIGTKPDWYIIQYTGKSGIQTALLSPENMEKLCDALWLNWSNISGMNDVYAAVADPFQYIVSIQRGPAGSVFWRTDSSVLGYVVLGTVDTGVQALFLNDEAELTIDCKVPKNPYAANSADYFKSEQFSKYSIRLPGIGWIPLPADLLYNAENVQVTFRANPNSGDMMVTVSNLTNTIASARGKITVPWGISGASTSPSMGKGLLGASAGAIGGISGLLKGDLTDAALGLATAGAAFAQTNVETLGGLGGAVGLSDDILIQVRYQDPIFPDTTTNGLPYMQESKLSNHFGGYVICQKGTFDGPCTSTEKDMINSFMTGGFFYD